MKALVKKARPWKKTLNEYSHILIAGSLLAVVLAGMGASGLDFWLASTQWLLVAAVLAILAVYVKLEG